MSFPQGFAIAIWALVTLTCACERPAEKAPSRSSTPQRIVSLAPSVTETLFALGAGDRIVGVTRFCDYPPEATTRQPVGGLTDVDVELVVSLKPDLVVGVSSQTGRALERTLAQADVDTLFLRVETLEDVKSTFRELGTLVGQPENAARLVRELEAHEVEPDGEGPRVLVLFGRDPWIGAGPGTFADEMIRRAGARNALEGMASDYPMLDAERMVTLSPDLVFDASFGKTAAAIPGVDSVVRVDPGLIRPGPRLADALKLFVTEIQRHERTD